MLHCYPGHFRILCLKRFILLTDLGSMVVESRNFLQKTTFEQVERSQTTEDNFQKIRDVTGLADVPWNTSCFKPLQAFEL
jgi:hypothetical protein